MSIFKRLVRAAALSLVVGMSLVLMPAANGADIGGRGFRSGGSSLGGDHGGFANRSRSDADFRAGGIGDRERGIHDGMTDRAVQFRDWQSGAWIGIGPDYDGDPYGSYWSFYCDPSSPYFTADACHGY